MQMASLPVAIPLIVAAILAGAGDFFHRRALDVIALATSAAVLAISIYLAILSSKAPIVYWFGGWQPEPHSHFPVGICFAIDPFGAGLAALVSLLVLAAFTFSWSYFESVKSFYHALMLAFLGAMCGLCLTGDLFNLFVWFELMTAAGVALCGYKSEESQSLQGALNFAVTNTIAAFLSLTGIALLYAFTGSLNMAEVGATLSTNSPNASFLAVAFLFVIAGFLVKSATFPFHFWLADAHAVAPTPVCILFSGVMVELGLYAIARIYWVVFAGSPQPLLDSIRTIFLVMGALTAVLGALFCFGQRHLKRLLAFSTMSHLGLMLLGFALLDHRALSGTALYLVGHGMIKASLFIGAGILLHRFRSVDEYDIDRASHQVLPIGLMMVVGAWGLAGLPPFATYFGEGQMEKIGTAQHLAWFSAIFIFAEIMTAAAVLRFSARVFFGIGRARSHVTAGASHIPMKVETHGKHSRVPAVMWVPMALLLIAAILISFPIHHPAERYARQFQNAQIYDAAVLQISAHTLPSKLNPYDLHDTPLQSTWWTRIVVVFGMFGIAALGLFPRSRVASISKGLAAIVAAPLKLLRPLQSGRVGDYVAWFAFGIAAYGGILLFLMR
jgi:multicomponent Na+:H+ antiporter subunit D